MLLLFLLLLLLGLKKVVQEAQYVMAELLWLNCHGDEERSKPMSGTNDGPVSKEPPYRVQYCIYCIYRFLGWCIDSTIYRYRDVRQEGSSVCTLYGSFESKKSFMSLRYVLCPHNSTSGTIGSLV